MRTRDFITQAFNGQTRRKECSSVFRDDSNNVYSCDHHYPLLFRVNGLAIRNVRGYSTTTGRHISWTRDIDAIDINVPRDLRLNGWDGTADVLAKLTTGQQKLIDNLQQQMASKKRHNTQVYRWLQERYTRAVNNLTALTA